MKSDNLFSAFFLICTAGKSQFNLIRNKDTFYLPVHVHLNNFIIIMRSALQDNHEKLITQYEANFADICALQSTLNNELLPYVAQELSLSDADYTWAKEWISDTGKYCHQL